MWLNSIKRRFSSTEVLDATESETTGQQQQQPPDKNGLALNMTQTMGPRPRKNPSPSAPSSPTKTLSLSSMMSAAKDIISNTTTAATNTVASSTGLFSNQATSPGSINQQQPRGIGGNSTNASGNANRRKILLIIDDVSIDWSKYFRSKRIGECELRIEQVGL